MMPRKHNDYLHNRREEVARWVSLGDESERAIHICEEWICETVSSGFMLHGPIDLLQLPSHLNLVDRLQNAGLNNLSQALSWRITTGGVGVEPPEVPQIGHSLAVAMGRVYAENLTRQLDWIGQFVNMIDHQGWEAFADAVAESFRLVPERSEAFLDMLNEILEEVRNEPDNIIDTAPRGSSFALIIEEYRRSGSFDDIWNAGNNPIIFRYAGKFEILRRFDPNRYLKLIDLLPHPALVKQCLSMEALQGNRIEVQRLLSLANPAFDSNGKWQPNAMAAVLLLQLASVQLLSVAIMPEARGRLESSLIPTSDGSTGADIRFDKLTEQIEQYKRVISDLLEVFFGREDSVELGWHWLERLFRETPRYVTEGGNSQERKLMIDHIGILIYELSRRLSPRQSPIDWVEGANPFSRQYRASSILSVVAFSSAGDGSEVGALAQALLKNNMFELMAPNEQLHMPGAPMRVATACAIAQIPNTSDWYTTTWSELRLQREQAWFRTPNKGQFQPNPAKIMAIWGLGVIELILNNSILNGGNLQAGIQMWFAVEVTFREARIVEPRIYPDFWGQAVAQLFSFWPRLFANFEETLSRSEEIPTQTISSLSKDFFPYFGINADFTSILVSLHLAGIASAVLDQATTIAGEDLVHIINRFLEITPRIGDPKLWNTQWVATLTSIKDEIEIYRRGMHLN